MILPDGGGLVTKVVGVRVGAAMLLAAMTPAMICVVTGDCVGMKITGAAVVTAAIVVAVPVEPGREGAERKQHIL